MIRTVAESMQSILKNALGFVADTLAKSGTAVRGALSRTRVHRTGPIVMPMVRGLSPSASISLTMRDGTGTAFESVRMHGGRQAPAPTPANAPAWDEAVRRHLYG